MEHELPVLYSADWCKPCAAVKKRLNGVEFKYTPADIDKVDVPPSVRSIPTMILVNGDVLVGTDKILEHVNGL